MVPQLIKMNILIIGSGGREHAIGLKLSQSPQRPTLFFAPGNPGMEALGKCFSIAGEDFPALLKLVESEKIDLTLVGPEIPLVAGIVDVFESQGHKIFGPSKKAAALEGSKAFSKDFMQRYHIPTAAFQNFTDLVEAQKYLRQMGAPIVIKASGLAAGKGAVVCLTLQEAEDALLSMLGPSAIFGDAGSEVVIEEFMEGEEASVFALTDGENFVLLPTAQDHKRIGDGDTGLNTGGMGAYSPAPIMSPEMLAEINRTIIAPTLAGMRAEHATYRGILFVGIMVTQAGPKVVEFNCRLGDPETQVVLPILEEDLLELILASLEGKLNTIQVEPPKQWAAVVVMAAEGYPGAYSKNVPIEGLEKLSALPHTHLVHAGTQKLAGQIVSSGGRVLGLVGQGPNLKSAIDSAYVGVEKIQFKGAQFRSDIGKKGLARLAG